MDWELNRVFLEKFFVRGGWLLEVAIIGLLVFIINFLIKLGLKRIAGKLKSREKIATHSFAEAFSLPLRVFMWIISLTLAIDLIYFQWDLIHLDLYGKGVFQVDLHLGQLRKLSLILLFGWFLLRWKKTCEKELLHRLKKGELPLEQAQLDMISKLATVVIVVLMVLMSLNTLGVDIMALVAVGGLGGIAVGFAGKDVFANFFGGFMIHITRPFVVGDLILATDKNLEGYIERVGWYLTQMRGVDKRAIYVPNALFSTAIVSNATRMTHRRIVATLSLRYQDLPHIPKIVAEIEALLRQHVEIDKKENLIVAFNQYSASSLDIFVCAFTKTTPWAEYLAIQQEIFLKMAEIVQQEGADFAFPTTTVDLPPLHIASLPREK